MLSETHTLPEASLLLKDDAGIRAVRLADLLKGRRVVIFAVPGAFTPTCDAAHLPSFVRSAAALRDRGVDEIICISVNDPHVMHLWGQMSGAALAGITMLADPAAEFTRAIGMDYSVPERGMLNRSRRYAMLVEDRVVKILNLEETPGVCGISAGETLLDQL